MDHSDKLRIIAETAVIMLAAGKVNDDPVHAPEVTMATTGRADQIGVTTLVPEDWFWLPLSILPLAACVDVLMANVPTGCEITDRAGCLDDRGAPNYQPPLTVPKGVGGAYAEIGGVGVRALVAVSKADTDGPLSDWYNPATDEIERCVLWPFLRMDVRVRPLMADDMTDKAAATDDNLFRMGVTGITMVDLRPGREGRSVTLSSDPDTSAQCTSTTTSAPEP